MEALFSEEELKEEIVRIMKTLYDKGLITALGGNVSARFPGASEFYITPSQVFKGALKPDDIIKVDLDGNLIEGVLRPSVETPAHALVYKVRPDVNAIIHAHSPWTLGLLSSGRKLKTTITEEAVLLLRRIEVIPFKFPGTIELAKMIEEAASKGARAILMKNHGVMSLGADLLEAEAVVELIESISIIEFVCYALGEEPPDIPAEEIEIAKIYLGV
ncbi:MAG: class II aldolase/adducin family protein [Nitrososphaerales archaeon]